MEAVISADIALSVEYGKFGWDTTNRLAYLTWWHNQSLRQPEVFSRVA